MKEKQFIKQKTLLAFLLIRIALLTAVSIYLKKRNMIKRKHILTHIKMGKEILTFGDIEIERK